MRVLFATLLLLPLACTGLDKKGSAAVPNPVGPLNSAGKPDISKTQGELGLGGDPNAGGTPDVGNTNAGGAPDPKKSRGKVGNTGAANSGGKPDVSKSVPKSNSK